jgi:hypothetical protein
MDQGPLVVVDDGFVFNSSRHRNYQYELEETSSLMNQIEVGLDMCVVGLQRYRYAENLRSRGLFHNGDLGSM